MPKLEPKNIQGELEKNQFRSFYWLHGSESMKMRELSKRIIRGYLTPSLGTTGGFSDQFGEIHLDGASTTVENILEELQSLSLGISTKVVLLKNAHLLKDLETLALKAPNQTFGGAEKEPAILVCWSKDLDLRKKSSKVLIDRAAVIACEEIAERDRQAWIQYLMKRRSENLDWSQYDWLTTELLSLDPWSLDIVDQCLDQFELTPPELRKEAFKHDEVTRSGEEFIRALLGKDQKNALFHLNSFSRAPEASLPLLGLIAWNFRMLTSLKLGTHAGKSMNSMAKDRLSVGVERWSTEEVVVFQSKLTSFDASLKGSGEDAHAAWTNLVRSVPY